MPGSRQVEHGEQAWGLLAAGGPWSMGPGAILPGFESWPSLLQLCDSGSPTSLFGLVSLLIE